MKYIVTKFNHAYIFPDDVSHASICSKNVRSAGYLKPFRDGIKLFGKSKSLKVSSNQDDAKVVMRKLKELHRNFFV